ncbi:hypothetical protein PHAVU_003G139100 [Phaseolus vulgaris]|uniref:Uncharacterized protein n=1 Tax=Phaseolus vulgaris TaxID=3885 RepID=V7C982_PHAVU|nr:hypothetical protein PHAVU_003G139100g [Phaseolus vulgaris]ESW26679.1 hypothetical protein PHAVU_003G139100g [Phaseolus vulgaris]
MLSRAKLITSKSSFVSYEVLSYCFTIKIYLFGGDLDRSELQYRCTIPHTLMFSIPPMNIYEIKGSPILRIGVFFVWWLYYYINLVFVFLKVRLRFIFVLRHMAIAVL